MADHGLELDAVKLERGFQQAMSATPKPLPRSDSLAAERAYWRAIVSSAIRFQAELPSNFDTLFEALWSEFAKGRRWRLNDDARELFDALDQREVPFSLLTNWDPRVLSVLDDHRIRHRFERIFISSEIGFQKPDRAIFAHAASQLGRSPAELMHIGDHPEQDVAGALRAGWKALHFTQSPSPSNAPAPTIARLRDALAFLPTKQST